VRAPRACPDDRGLVVLALHFLYERRDARCRGLRVLGEPAQLVGDARGAAALLAGARPRKRR
jgi:hypothetical protein